MYFKKYWLIAVVNLIVSNSLFASNVSVVFDKDSYSDGEIARITAVSKVRSVNPDLDYILEGYFSTNGVSKKLIFHKMNNVFITTTSKLDGGTDLLNVLHLDLKLVNTKKINELSEKIQSFENEINRLQSYSSESFSIRIAELKAKVEDWQKEISRQVTLVEAKEIVIPVQGLSCNFKSYEELKIEKESLDTNEILSLEDFSPYKSYVIERDGHTYEVTFLVSKRNRKIEKMSSLKLENVDYCTDEYEQELSDDMLPSWTSGRNVTKPLLSTYESAVKCSKDNKPYACKLKVTLSAGPCDGRHSTAHTGSRPLGRFTDITEGTTYNVPATALGRPYKYIAPDVAGDVSMDFVVTLDGQVFNLPYMLRVFVPGLVNLSNTLGLSDYLEWDVASHNNLGSYGVPGFGLAITLALQTYTNSALERGIPNVRGENQFFPLSSGGVSLEFGGLLDIGRSWTIPHRRHRQGVDMDIGMTLLTNHSHGNTLKDILNYHLRSHGFIFDVDAESILNPSINHWHIRFPYGELVDSNGGR